MNEFKKYWLPRGLIGAVIGVMACVLLAWLTQPGWLFAPLTLDFAFCYNSDVPEVLGAVLGIVLWALFGAEVGIATIPFADSGRELVIKSLLHYLVTSVTVSAWVMLNFAQETKPLNYLFEFLVPLTLVYLLVWLGRWVGWYAEVDAIREKLGLAPGPSLFKWRESLPYFGYAFLLCLALPMLLRVLDADAPILSIMYAWLLLPVGGFMSGLSLGKRQGVCPLYPVVCAGFILIFIPLARLCDNRDNWFLKPDDWPLVPLAFAATLLGNLAGAAYTVKRRKGGREV